MLKVCVLFIAITYSFIPISVGQAIKVNAGGVEINTSSVDTNLSDAFYAVGEMPEFPGGTKKLIAFAKSKLCYPKSAINDNIQGSVVLIFIINKKGEVTNKKIFKGVRADLNSLCLKMLNLMPLWKAGRLNGKALAVYEMWTIKFVLI